MQALNCEHVIMIFKPEPAGFLAAIGKIVVVGHYSLTRVYNQVMGQSADILQQQRGATRRITHSKH